MGLFNSKKRKEREAERYYGMSLNHDEHELEYLQKSVALGSKHGKEGLARYYLEHNPNDVELMKTAVRLMTEAEAEGAFIDQNKLIKIADNAGEYSVSFAVRTKLAEGGDKFAQFDLGYQYSSGSKGAPFNLDKAWYWYDKAAAQGHAGAINNMAIMKLNRRSVSEDEKQAIELMTKSAEKGNAVACGNLAWDYYEGAAPFVKDYERAFQYAQMGAEKDNQKCRYVMALLKAEGLGTERDLAGAVKLFEKLAEEKYKDSQELFEKYSVIEKAFREEDFNRRYDETYKLIENEPERTLKIFNEMSQEGNDAFYRRANEGWKAAKYRITELADIRFDKALSSGDIEAMKKEAKGGSPKGSLYFLRQAAAMAPEAVKTGKIPLSDEELLDLGDYCKIARNHDIDLSEQEINGVATLDFIRARQLIDEDKSGRAMRILESARRFNDPFCQALWAELLDNGSWWCEDKAIEILEEIYKNKKVYNDEYKKLRNAVDKHLSSLRYNRIMSKLQEDAEIEYYEKQEHLRKLEKLRKESKREHNERLRILDDRERFFNALTNNNAFTNEESYLAGNLSDQEYMRRKFLRDQKEEKYRREYEESLRSVDDD
ncbi:MAG TPA: sel1 repeat family protein [Candidatus Egerieimonas intestinavium]|uniref:Sel1 repeat family protein n=1 Tax=Candidatus Egerieimonas intestinavium TaxID=2840777 RepID=A0A9D1JEK5_9FIRM|nr:sel1 repeat family protein [Candidatus Egerieimonas intestinavium]